jgi:predicted secreted protein
MIHKQTGLFPVIFLAFSAALILAGCAKNKKIVFEGNQSSGESWKCNITPEGVVRLVSGKYHILMPFPGMGGNFVFKFRAISEGEADINLTHSFRGEPQGTITYIAVVDKDKKLTIKKKN